MDPHTLQKKKVLLITLFCGFWGGHHFYLGARQEALIYLLFSWTAIPGFASTLDLMRMVFKAAEDPVFTARPIALKHQISNQTIRHLIIAAVIVVVWVAWGVQHATRV